jgi:hypothetical protein
MDSKPHSSIAWPLTFGGVAELARGARTRQLRVYRRVIAIAAAASLTTFFELGWVPVIYRTIVALPPRGFIQNEQLTQIPPSPVREPGNGFLAITIDANNTGTPGEGADLQLRFQKSDVRFRSLFGDLALPYPPEVNISLNRTDLEPWWGAWHPAITASLAATVVVGLLVAWTGLALIYAWPARAIAFYADRELSWAGAWRLSSAALLPGALFLTLAIVAYTLRQLNLVHLLVATVLHVMIGWIYLCFSPLCLPRVGEARAAAARAASPSKGKAVKRKNPFAGPPT